MSKPTKVRVVAIGGPLEGYEWEFDQDTITIGRSTSNDVSLRDDTTVSRSHATLRWAGGSWEMRDDNSANGTHVLENGLRKRLNGPYPFETDRRFYFGSSEVEFRLIQKEVGNAFTQPPETRKAAAPDLRRSLQLSISLAGDELVHRVTSLEAVVSEYRIPFSMREVDDLKQRLRDAVARTYHLRLSGEASPPESMLPEMHRLGDWLKSHCIPRHVRKLLDGSSEVYVTLVLDSELLGVPWELATLGEGVMGLRYAVGRQIIFRDPGSIRQAPTRVAMEPTTMLIVANPTGDLREAQRHGEELLNLTRRRLPNAEVDFLAGERARKVDVLGRIEEADIVYFVGHTEHDPADPANSAWTVADDRIYGREFERLHPAPRLVFANSCESARESFVAGQGPAQSVGGIARAFIAAGTLNYVGSLWPIAAGQSARFGREAFEAVFDGRSVGEAVRLARHKCISEFGLGDPVWAGYVVYGDPTLSPL